MSASCHLALEIPLHGIQLIQASAGTGKTFTLALLAARLVIETNQTVDKILIVTFTKAATQELREKLRQQLRLAAELASLSAESLLKRERNDDARLTWPLIEAALVKEGEVALQMRLQQAVLDIDLAAVFTIDGFCLRILSEEALAADQPLEPPELISSERELHEEVAYEIWRHFCQSPLHATLLLTLWKEPIILAQQLTDLLSADVLLPDQAAIAAAADSTTATVEAASAATVEQALRRTYFTHVTTAKDALAAACTNNVMNRTSYKDNTIAQAWYHLELLIDAPPLSFLDTKQLMYLSHAHLIKNTKKGYAGQTPSSPLFEAIDAWCVAAETLIQQREIQRAALLHDVRTYAKTRIGELKRLRRQQGFADLIAQLNQALQSVYGEQLAQRLRKRYAVALIDEFQDTDPQQWQIFRRLFGHSVETNALFLIGDPKQAIYGFRGGDVRTYLEAAHSAQGKHTLSENFRSRPSVLTAIASLFKQGGLNPFIEPGIDFPAVQPGGSILDSHFSICGHAAPALTVCTLPNPTEKAITAERARALATHACVFRIRELLAAGRVGKAQLTLKQNGNAITRGVQPSDIAVLVSNHKQAQYIQYALAEAGIASVSVGKQSLFATAEACELLLLLEALCAPTDDRRLRAALATVLLGENALAIESLARDESRQRIWLGQFQDWRQRWERHGPLPMIIDRVATAGPRLLALADGERRMSNYLQLGEALQEASAAALGALGLVHWLARGIAKCDENDEVQQLRLESDAKRVQIMTLHKSKGLEFPLVFLPFLALPPPSPQNKNSGLALLRYHDGMRRILHANIDLPETVSSWDEAQALANQEQRAEQLRLLYVALTRAQHALWLAWGPVNGAHYTALAGLLHHGQTPDSAAIELALEALTREAPHAIVRIPFPDLDTPLVRLPPEPRQTLPPLHELRREFSNDWSVHSFSQLTRAESPFEEHGANDEWRSSLPMFDARFSGVRFGNALHKALETINFALWRPNIDVIAPENEHTTLASALRGEGYSANDLLEGVPLLARMIHATLNVRLPEGARLGDLPERARRSEMEFHFAFKSVRVTEIIALLHSHGAVTDRHGFGLHQRLQGLMTGKIDLVYEYQDRVYLLDYKSNTLPDYESTTLALAMRNNEYDLQYLIYTLALHRWLRFRRPTAYDYDRHFGGVRYLFCRGLEPNKENSLGIFSIKPSRRLIEMLDAVLAPETEAIA